MTQSVMLVFGTRPEAVKMAPIVKALERTSDFKPIVAVTGQHRSMLDQVTALFEIEPQIDLDIHRPGHTLAEVTSRALLGLDKVLDEVRPDIVMVQGDTTTTLAAAMAAFYARIPLVHVEAGLRTGHRMNPYPEEANRRLTTVLAELHLAPTWASRENLVREGIPESRIVVTGNSVIDALFATLRHPATKLPEELAWLDDEDNASRPVLLVTAHRRESWGEPMRRIGRALGALARRFPELLVVLPVHGNPLVRAALLPELAYLPNAWIVEPLDYGAFVRLMERARIVLTDSGGVQEEAPSLGKPVLVMRETTERPEGVAAGTVRLVGTETHDIVEAVSELLLDPAEYEAMANAVNPYGDGLAAARSVAALRHTFAAGPPPHHLPQAFALAQ
jgi:UDP-N-acetylglucosamine 2-epimerase (non-hydrolysing)